MPLYQQQQMRKKLLYGHGNIKRCMPGISYVKAYIVPESRCGVGIPSKSDDSDD